jgi:flagellar biogenesis protein FliO
MIAGRRAAAWRLSAAALLAVGVLLAFVPTVARAQEGDEPASIFPSNEGGGLLPTPVAGGGITSYGTSDWLGLGLRLSLVLLAIWGAIVAMRWWVRRQSGAADSPTRRLELLETRSLGPNRALHLVRVGGRAVLIGATAEHISALLAVDDPAEIERLLEVDEAPGAGPRSLGELRRNLGGVLSRLSAPRTQVERPASSTPAAVSPSSEPVAPAAPAPPAAAAAATPRAQRLGELTRAVREARQELGS